MSAQLKMRGHNVGRRKARRYMDEMAIDPIYPKMNLSKRGLYRGLQKGVPCGKASYFKLRPGMPVHQFRLQGLPEGERHPAEHGRQKPLGGQHPDRALVPHLQV